MGESTAAGPVLRGSASSATLLEGLGATHERLRALVEGQLTSALDAAAPGEWSARTVLAHLRDDEFLVMRLRLERMLAEEHPTLTPFDEQAWAGTRWRGRDGASDLLEDFAEQRAASLQILARLDEAAWTRLGTQPEIGTFDVRHWVEHWLDHDEQHLRQIAAALEGAR